MGRPRKIKIKEEVPLFEGEMTFAKQTRSIQELNDKFTPALAQKVIAHHIENNGTCFQEITNAMKGRVNNSVLRSLFIPLSLYGLNCDSKYILPILKEISSASGTSDADVSKEKQKVKIEKEIIDGALATFEGYIDEIMQGNDVDSTKLIHLFSLPLAKNLPKYVEERMELLEEDYDCFPEQYKHIPKRMFNKMMKMCKEIVNPESETRKALLQKVQKEKNSKVRVAKPRNILKAVEKFKYFSQEFANENKEIEFPIKSLHPSKIQGAKIAFCFDVQNRKMFRYQAEPGTTLSIKGTTIYNVDLTKSYRKNIRNVDGVIELSKKVLNTKTFDDFLKKINAKELPLISTRSNSFMVILGAF